MKAQVRAEATVGVAEHGNSAVLVTVTGSGELLDRRRVDLTRGLPTHPYHHEGSRLCWPLPGEGITVRRDRPADPQDAPSVPINSASFAAATPRAAQGLRSVARQAEMLVER
jgi:hypothetical protein